MFILNNSINAWSKYEVGKKVTYNGIDFYVIKDSDKNNEIVKLLKTEPLTVEEVNLYGGVGTDNNHVNNYYGESYKTAVNLNGYGGMVYYTSESCLYDGNQIKEEGCKIDSDIKHVVDAWTQDKFDNNILIKTSLLSLDDLLNSLGYDVKYKVSGGNLLDVTSNVPKWVYSENYSYWTTTQCQDSLDLVSVMAGGIINYRTIYAYAFAVRPVIELSKFSLGDSNIIDDDTNENENIDKDDKNNASDNNSTKESKVTVNVPNTMQKISIL